MSFSTEAAHFRDSLSAEFYKVRRRRMTYILLAVHCALVLLFYFILFMQIRDGPSHRRNGLSEWLALRNAMSTLNVVPYGFALERFFATLVCVALCTFSINLLFFVSNGFFVLADVCVVTCNGAVIALDFPVVLANLRVVLLDLAHRAGLGKCSYTHQREQASKQD